MKKAIVFGLVILTFLSCEKDNKADTVFIDSLDLITGDCYSSIEQSIICFDTVLTDSRCAQGAICKWAGNATINFNLTLLDNIKHVIELNTNPDFSIDTTIENIYILLTELTPYPEISMVISPKDYKAKLTIANIENLKSNAQILSFNPEKEACAWGWTIKVGTDTIKSDEEVIGKIIGYNIDYPIDVYTELGEIEQTCTGGFDYYKLKQIIKTK